MPRKCTSPRPARRHLLFRGAYIIPGTQAASFIRRISVSIAVLGLQIIFCPFAGVGDQDSLLCSGKRILMT